jgi:hypothetical protein
MANTDLNKKKLDLIAWIYQLSDESFLDFLTGLKKSNSKSDWWTDLTEDQKQLILKGIEEVESGKTVSSALFWKKLNNVK